MKVQIKKLNENAIIPFYSKDGDAGLDLTAISKKITSDYIEYGIGLAIEIPIGYVGLVFPRSSISNTNMTLTNSVGVIDPNYRGELLCKFRRNSLKDKDISNDYQIGDRVAQLLILPYPQIELVETKTLSDTNRGVNGFGSSGK